MIGRMVFCLALVCGAGAASAQEPACTLYKVNTSMLNVSKDAGGQIYNDALFDGDSHLRHPPEECRRRRLGVYLLQAGQRQRAYAGRGLGGAAIPATDIRCRCDRRRRRGAPRAALPQRPRRHRRRARVRPPPRLPGAPVTPSGAAATARPEDVLRFNQPIPFGAFPVNGHSIQEMIDQTPFFPRSRASTSRCGRRSAARATSGTRNDCANRRRPT